MASAAAKALQPHYKHFSSLPGWGGRFLGGLKDTVLNVPNIVLGVVVVLAIPETSGLLLLASGGALLIHAGKTLLEGMEARSIEELKDIDRDRTVQKLAKCLHRQHEITGELGALAHVVDDRHPVTKLLHRASNWDVFEHRNKDVHKREDLWDEQKDLKRKIKQYTRSHGKAWEDFIRRNATDAAIDMATPRVLADIASDYSWLADHTQDTARVEALKDKVYLFPQSFVDTQRDTAITTVFAATPAPRVRTVLVTNYDTLLRSQDQLEVVEQGLQKVRTPRFVAMRAPGTSAYTLYMDQETLQTAIKTSQEAIDHETEKLPSGYAEGLRHKAQNTVEAALGKPLTRFP